jgi:hypothetical protein
MAQKTLKDGMPINRRTRKVKTRIAARIQLQGGGFASFLFHHFCLCPMCESTLELGLQELLLVVEEISFELNIYEVIS